jgi:hypothetical protein
VKLASVEDELEEPELVLELDSLDALLGKAAVELLELD